MVCRQVGLPDEERHGKKGKEDAGVGRSRSATPWNDGDGVCNDGLTESGFASRIARARKLVDELRVAYREAGKANLTRARARHVRRQAIERCESVLQDNAQITERFLMQAGRRDLVVDVRGKLPPGRPRKDDLRRSEGEPKLDAVAATTQGRATLLSWIGRGAQKAGRLFRRDQEGRPHLRRAA